MISAMDMDNQILYKLGGIESQVASIRDDITKVVRRLEERIDDDRIETERLITVIKDQSAKDIKDLTERVTRNETKLNVVDAWRQAWITRTAWTLGLFGVGWTLFSEVAMTGIKAVFH